MDINNGSNPPTHAGSYRLTWFALAAVILCLLFLAIYVPILLYPALTPHQLGQLHLTGFEQASAQNDRLTLQNNVRTLLIQIIAGAGVISGAIVAWTQLRHGIANDQEQRRSQHATILLDRFVKGIEHLRDSSPDVRIGGIYSLAMVAEESSGHRPAVADVLSSFVRARSLWPPSGARPAMDAFGSRLAELRNYAPDVQAAMTVLGRHTASWYGTDGLRFRYCDLRRINLTAAHFELGRFTEAHLREAWMPNCHLEGASFRGADLTGANLSGAELMGANIRGANFTNAEIKDINLRDAIFDESTMWPEGFTGLDATNQGARCLPLSAPPTSGKVDYLPPI